MSRTLRTTPARVKSLRRQSTEPSPDQENTAPSIGDFCTPTARKPLIARKPDIPYELKQRLDNQHAQLSEQVSPGLARLRLTPGRKLKEKQEILTNLHEKAKNKADQLNVGGGISIWPEMENMRLSKSETIYLSISCIFLIITTSFLFLQLHGQTLQRLKDYNDKVSSFPSAFGLDTDSGNQSFVESVLKWHVNYRNLVDEIQDAFTISVRKTAASYYIYILLYTCLISLLLYYLMDNMFAESKLTPKRIKIWVTLLVVVGTWTFLILCLLVAAQRLEYAVETTVHKFSDEMADLVYRELDLARYNQVLQYWRIRCLPPTTQGTLSILDMVPVRDVAYYLQYYSLPVVTALVTPVVKLIVSLKDIYSTDV